MPEEPGSDAHERLICKAFYFWVCYFFNEQLKTFTPMRKPAIQNAPTQNKKWFCIKEHLLSVWWYKIEKYCGRCFSVSSLQLFLKILPEKKQCPEIEFNVHITFRQPEQDIQIHNNRPCLKSEWNCETPTSTSNQQHYENKLSERHIIISELNLLY